MSFEFDPSKSDSNKAKHGLDFLDAQQLWEDENLIELSSKNSTEKRYLAIGMIEGKHWAAIITYRSGVIRIISVRRARETEVKIYES